MASWDLLAAAAEVARVRPAEPGDEALMDEPPAGYSLANEPHAWREKREMLKTLTFSTLGKRWASEFASSGIRSRRTKPRNRATLIEQIMRQARHKWLNRLRKYMRDRSWFSGQPGSEIWALTIGQALEKSDFG